MLEIILCSLVTILPDYLYRRYGQGKRIGHEITLFSVWFELRFGIITCFMLAIALITTIFYFHPSTTSATLFYRTVPIVPEASGRVAEVHLEFSAPVKKGDVIFRLDNSKQQASLETAKRKIAEIDATMRRRRISRRRKVSFRKPRARCSRLRTSSTSSASCRSVTPALCRSAILKSSRWLSRAVKALWMP